MKQVGGWWIPDYMNSPGGHIGRSQVIDIALAYLPMDRRELAIQAGGHVGIWPKKLAEHFERVITWEPAASNYECLHANTKHLKRIVSIMGCLGDTDRDVELTLSTTNSGKHCVRRGGAVDCEAEMDRLDTVIESKIDAIFLDIEGYEYQALQGAGTMLADDHPLIVLEQNGLSKSYGHTDEDIAKMLDGLGYVVADKFEADVIYIPRDW